MLCTVIWDIYRSDERAQVWEALQSLLAEDSPDWSRKGVYGYWDPETRELLYLGLADNLAGRFAQHNGLVPHSGGNKSRQIEAWFEEHEQLGLTTMIQAAAVGSAAMATIFRAARQDPRRDGHHHRDAPTAAPT